MAGVVDLVLGPQQDNEAHEKTTFRSKFGNYCQTELHLLRLTLPTGSTVNDIESNLLAVITQLKSSPNGSKKTLKQELEESQGDTAIDQALILNLGVRLLYMTACTYADVHSIVSGDIFRPEWNDEESPRTFIDRVYSRSIGFPQDTSSVRIYKFSAGYLTSNVEIQLKWTDKLSDHLLLLMGDSWKLLYIFKHPAFLKHGLEMLRQKSPTLNQSTSEAMALGCLPPKLLQETLMTYKLLFPRAGDSSSRRVLEGEVKRQDLDPLFLRLSWLDAEQHNTFQDALGLTDVKSLFQRYPHWGERLYNIWKEVEDPTPITDVERWSEAKRNPRFTFWCTVVAVSLAIFFGVIATLLAAVQVWIGYCSWDINADEGACKLRKPPQPPVPTVVAIVNPGRI